MGGFSFFVFLNPWASIVNFGIVFRLGKDFLFKFSLAGSDYECKIRRQCAHNDLTMPCYFLKLDQEISQLVLLQS